MVGALDRVIGKLLAQAGHGALVLGRDQKPAGILVEAMDDAGPRLAANALQRSAAMGDQRVDQRAVGIAGRRMHDEAGRLVDDDEVGVLIDDGKRDVLAERRGGQRRRHRDGVGLARFDPEIAVSYRLARVRHGAGREQLLKTRTADIAERCGEEAVQPPSRLIRRDHRAARFFGGFRVRHERAGRS